MSEEAEEVPTKPFRFACLCPDCETSFYLFGQMEENSNVKMRNWGRGPSAEIICPACGHTEQFEKP